MCWAVASCAAQPRCLSRGTACGPSPATGSAEGIFRVENAREITVISGYGGYGSPVHSLRAAGTVGQVA